MEAKVKFGLRLRELREASGLSQDQLAERSGVSQTSIARYEQCQGDPAWSNVIRLASALGVHSDAFEEEPKIAAPEKKRGRPRKDQAPEEGG